MFDNLKVFLAANRSNLHCCRRHYNKYANGGTIMMIHQTKGNKDAHAQLFSIFKKFIERKEVPTYIFA